MYIDKNKFAASFDLLENNLKNHPMPAWEDFPDIELYMDQVISLITKYLEIYSRSLGLEKLITPSMINNYVKLKIIPPPEKKKYSRIHLAYLIIICTLKQTLDMATIQKIIPCGIDEERVKQIYSSFAENQKKASEYVTENVRSLAAPMFSADSDNQEEMNELLMQVCVCANIYKIFTESITKNSEKTFDNQK